MKVWINHPEAMDGEALVGHIGEPFTSQVQWSTVRFGAAFKNKWSHTIVPFFVQRSELEASPMLRGEQLELIDWTVRPDLDDDANQREGLA